MIGVTNPALIGLRKDFRELPNENLVLVSEGAFLKMHKPSSISLPKLLDLPRLSSNYDSGDTQRLERVTRLLRQAAVKSRGTEHRQFHSIRTVARHYGLPATAVARIYGRLKKEGVLATRWGSKTVIEPSRFDKHVRFRGVVAVALPLKSFRFVPNYREFYTNLEDSLYKERFVARCLFYENGGTDRAALAEHLLKQSPDVALFFLPDVKAARLTKRLEDHGIRVIQVADVSSPLETGYRLSRYDAIRDILVSWKTRGIRSITVFHDETMESAAMITLVETCLREVPIRYEVATNRSVSFGISMRAVVHRRNSALVFTKSELFAQLLYENKTDFDAIIRTQRVLLIQGAIDFPIMEFPANSVDIVEFDWKNLVKRIVDELTNWRVASDAQPTIFRAQWRTPCDSGSSQLTVIHSSDPPVRRSAKNSAA